MTHRLTLICRLLPLVLVALLNLPAAASNCENSSTGLVPLTDLGAGTYQGYEGGLYPGGSNVRPAAHDSAGIVLGSSIGLLNTAGNPDPLGRIVFISIGMSNCFLEYKEFIKWANSSGAFNHLVKMINCAQGGQVAEVIVDPTAPYWNYVDSQLAANASTPAQVQVIWFKDTNRDPNMGWPAQTQLLNGELGTLMQFLKQKFPNLKQVFLSSRVYGGYASITLSPEPYAYESGFAFKWLIEAQINGVDSLNYDASHGVVRAPWLSWGPYIWADGLSPRSDGLTWACSDFDTLDGIHPNLVGQSKVASILLNYFLNDPASIPWFRGPVAAAPQPKPAAGFRSAPNPARRSARISWEGAAAIDGVDILDPAGRRVRHIAATVAPGGSVEWDLRDGGGRPVANGIYWLRPVAGSSGRDDGTPLRPLRIVVQHD